jgi:hypothetical protein
MIVIRPAEFTARSQRNALEGDALMLVSVLPGHGVDRTARELTAAAWFLKRETLCVMCAVSSTVLSCSYYLTVV